MMFFELLWCRLDTLIASFFFNEQEIATQSGFSTIIMLTDCFAYGFGLTTAAMISRFIIQLKVNDAKKTAFVACFTILSLGALISIIVYTEAKLLAKMLIKDEETQESLEKIIKLYSPAIPIELLQGPVYAIVRSIGKQNYMVFCQLLSNYLVHFLVMYYCVTVSNYTNEAIVIACMCTFACMSLSSLMVAFLSDWTKEANKIRDEFVEANNEMESVEDNLFEFN